MTIPWVVLVTFENRPLSNYCPITADETASCNIGLGGIYLRPFDLRQNDSLLYPLLQLGADLQQLCVFSQ